MSNTAAPPRPSRPRPPTVQLRRCIRIFSAVVSRLVIIVPYVWLLVFFLIPFAIVFKISLSQTAIAMPPYTPVFDTRTPSSTACRN